jgi:cytochrome c2
MPHAPALLAATLLFVTHLAVAAESRSDAASGKAIFEQRCMICHAVSTTPSGPEVGPNMVGIVGRRAASVGSFAMYSPALKASGLTWTTRTLNEFLAMPTSMVPGTTMPLQIPDPKERADVIAYLATVN